MKIFLSHSSSDKDIVGKVFNELGAGICHYDIATFDPTGFLPEQIISALNESTHFVLFASAKALNSEWVKGELRSAFTNWMHSRTQKAMVFLMRDGERSAVPDWLQDYVITEHPSPQHIACRILGEYDDQQRRPPSYRTDEVKNLEKKIAVEASKMPTCTLTCGTDGMGRKELINELFDRRFRNVPRRKILLYSESFDSDIDLYKSLKGAVALTTAKELLADINRLSSLTLAQRLDELSDLIVQACRSAQTIVLDASDSIFTDSGEIIDWLEKLIEILPPSNYPLLNITTIRRPNFIRDNINDKIALCYLEPLEKGDSSLLFDWWLKELNISLSSVMTEQILDHVTGNPKLIETSVRLIKTIPDASDIRNIKKFVFPDLERSASKLLACMANDNLSKLMLSFTVDCGHINLSDLITTVSKVTGDEPNATRDCYSNLVAYGFLQADSTSVKVPNFIARAAKSIGQKEPILTNLKKCWAALADSISTIALDEETSISVINEACVLKLKLGTNSIIGIDSLILPSQCLRIARQSYDQNNFGLAYQLSERAFQSRLALTEDAAIEALRYCGMSAAREDEADKLHNTFQLFKQYPGNTRAQRISEFIQGFDLRLAGKFDDALLHMERALTYKGDQDLHVLRELAFLHLSTGSPQKAKTYINKAVGKARNNSFILELQVLIELAFGKGYVLHNEYAIQEMILALENMSFSNGYAFKANVEYLLVRKEIAEARALFDQSSRKGVINKLLEGELLIAENKYSMSVGVLEVLRKKVLDSKEPQRRSILPKVAELLIQASSGVSVTDGVMAYKNNLNYLPAQIHKKIREELINQAAYSRYKITHEEKIVLGI